jgi:hypothetical protein
VKEQLQQVQTITVQHYSTTTTRGPRDDDEVVVHLITISSDLAAATRAVDVCHGLAHLQCHHVRHAATGDEMVGLQQLFEYCQVHPLATVTYLHAKGSYHPSLGNDAWRRALTAAALHPDCWRHVYTDNYDDPVCHVCGLAFYTMFTSFWPGNMWTASCSYVTTLIPPASFAARLEAAVANLLLRRRDGVLQSLLLRDRPDYYGLNRYSAEHWIGSHPNLNPCDMDPSDEARPQSIFGPPHGHTTPDMETAWQFGRAPRHVGMAVGHNFDAHRRLHDSETDRHKELFLLPGRIFLWQELYGRLPPFTSWTWQWFPDGQYWQSRCMAAVRDDSGGGGGNVHDGIIEDGALTSMFRHLHSSAPTGIIDEQRNVWWEPSPAASPSSSSPGAIVYVVRLDNNRLGVDMVMDRMKVLRQETGRDWPVALTVIGDNSYDARKLSTLCDALWLKCHVREATTSPSAVATLWWDYTATLLARFCEGQQQGLDSSSVVFQLSDYPCQETGPAATRRRNAGGKRTGEDGTGITCTQQQHDCTRGFVAQCSFVNQLMEPASFLRGVEAAIKMVLLANVRNERRWTPMTQSHGDTGTGTMAVEQWLLYAWMAMHPTVLPCDDVCGDLMSPGADRDRDLILAVLLVVEVFYENQGHHHNVSMRMVPPCAQQWKQSLQVKSSSSVAQFLNMSIAESSQRIYQAMKLGENNNE